MLFSWLFLAIFALWGSTGVNSYNAAHGFGTALESSSRYNENSNYNLFSNRFNAEADDSGLDYSYGLAPRNADLFLRRRCRFLCRLFRRLFVRETVKVTVKISVNVCSCKRSGEGRPVQELKPFKPKIHTIDKLVTELRAELASLPDAD